MKEEKKGPTRAISKKQALSEGMRDGLPIAAGYLAVAFSLGIAAREAGITPLAGFVMSLLNNASAGEYAGIVLITAGASYLETAAMTLITNARYLLMSCALSQRFSQDTGIIHRLLVGFDITDEIFGITVARSGYVDPYYTYGAMLLAMPAWAVGTSLGITAGNLLPARIVSALSVALYGMFLAIIIPPAKKDRVVAALVAISFALSFCASRIPLFSSVSEGTRTIVITLAVSAAAALLFPRPAEEDSQ